MLIGLLFAAIIVGIAVGVFTSRFEFVKAKKGTFILFVPSIVIFFLHLIFPNTTEILYASFVFSIVVFLTWCYFDTKNKGE